MDTTLGIEARVAREICDIRAAQSCSRPWTDSLYEVSDASDELPNDDLLAEMVHGTDLNVPLDVEEVGPWTHTEEGEEYRELRFSPLYAHPWGAGTAALIGRQGRNGRVIYSIEVNVTAELSTDEAALLKSALDDLIENVNQNNKWLG